ncbi:MAG: ABC transporter permease, partial [Alphaproteobacteria bacterium]
MRQAEDLSGIWGWRAVWVVTIAVYVFMFAPIIVTVILSFNASMFGGFPMTGLSLQWYGKLFQNEAVLRAFKTSIWIAVLTAAVCTVLGVMAALALTRYEFRGKEAMNTLVIMPALVPETILGVGLLLLMKWLHQPRSYMLLVLGHIM